MYDFDANDIAPNLCVHWAWQGHLVLSVVLRMMKRSTLSPISGRSHTYERSTKWSHFTCFEAARMMYSTRTSHDKRTNFHHVTYRSLHRALAELMLNDAWLPIGRKFSYVGAMQTMFYAECRMEQKRRFGAAEEPKLLTLDFEHTAGPPRTDCWATTTSEL